jgi:hypothetical protein
MQGIRSFENALLQRSQYLLDDLPHLRLHLKPLELLDLELPSP